MDINKNNLCRLCGKLFCCNNCRKKHVVTEHSEESHPDCPLCNNSDLVLRWTSIEPALFAHIAQIHLPLGCIKCNKIVQSEADLRKLDHTCVLINVQPQPDIVVTASPDLKTCNESKVHARTPKFNLRMMAAGNNSASMVRSTSMALMSSTGISKTTTQLIRSTSTPTVQELTCVVKTTNQFMNGSVSQLSSICNQSSVIATSPLGVTPMAPKVDKFKMPLYQKMRSKGSNVQTPLRQVMSQNVQRALMNHDFLSTSSGVPQLHCPSPSSQPLDLCTRKSTEPAEPECGAVEEIVEEMVPDLLKTPMKDYGLDMSKGSPSDCEFYTPHNARYTRRRRSSIFVQVDEYECDDDPSSDCQSIEVLSSAVGGFVEDIPELEPKISLWNVLSTVFRFASNRLLPRTDSESNNALALVKADTEEEGGSTSSMKRPLASEPKSPLSRNPPKRIRGRPPIARMRQLKDN